MATFTKRGGSWRCIIRRKGFKTTSKTFTTKAKAQAWAETAEFTLTPNPFDAKDKSGLTVKDCLIRYRDEVSIHKKSHISESWRVKVLCGLPIAAMLIHAVQAPDLAKLRDMRLKVVSPASVRLELMLISHLYTIAIKEWGLPLINHVANIRKPKVDNARSRRLQGNELEWILACCDDEMRVWVIVAIETAMRRSEQHSITKQTMHGGFVHLSDTKNGCTRIVPLSSRARAALDTLEPDNDGCLWQHPVDYYSRAFKRACSLANVTGLRLHDLRREGISRLFEKGLNQFEVKAISGHKTTQMLERYVNVIPQGLLAKLG